MITGAFILAKQRVSQVKPTTGSYAVEQMALGSTEGVEGYAWIVKAKGLAGKLLRTSLYLSCPIIGHDRFYCWCQLNSIQVNVSTHYVLTQLTIFLTEDENNPSDHFDHAIVQFLLGCQTLAKSAIKKIEKTNINASLRDYARVSTMLSVTNLHMATSSFYCHSYWTMLQPD